MVHVENLTQDGDGVFADLERKAIELSEEVSKLEMIGYRVAFDGSSHKVHLVVVPAARTAPAIPK
jgi:hypothetical protein